MYHRFFVCFLIFLPITSHPKVVIHPLPENRVPKASFEETGDRLQDYTELSESLQRFPGATLRSQGSIGQVASIGFRGLRQQNTLILMDGIPMNGSNMGYYDLSNLLSHSVQKVTLQSGPETILEGGGTLGGVVHITTRQATDPNPNQVTLEGGSFKTQQAASSVGYQGPSYDMIAHGHVLSTGGLPTYHKAGYRMQGEGNAYTHEGGSFFFNKRWRAADLSFFVKHATHTLDYDEKNPPLPQDPTAVQKGRSNSMGARLTLQDAKAFSRHVLLCAKTGEQSVFESTSSSKVIQSTHLTRYEGSFFWNTRNTSKVSLGFQEDQVQNTPLKKKSRDTYGALFHRLFILKDLSLAGGLNGTTNNHFGFHRSHTAEIRYSPNAFSFHVGLKGMRRTPTLTQRFSENIWIKPNPLLKPEKGRSLEFGVHYAQHQHSLDLTFFKTRTKSMIIYSTSSFVNAQGAVETKGLESFYRLNIGKSVKAQITYTFLTFGNNREGSDIKIPRHQVAGDIFSHLSENCSLSLSSQWVSQRKSWKKETPLKSYTLTHMKVRYKIWDNWHTYLKIHNMFNTSYETSLGYRMPRRGIYVGTTLTF